MPAVLPIAVIDFEASGLGSESYPIEVGVTIVRVIDTPVASWSTLIRPHPTWQRRGTWDRKAERLHGITPDRLAGGLDAAETLERLNDFVSGIDILWCDGGGYDSHWFSRLCRAAPLVRPAFALRDIAALFVGNRRAYNRYADAIGRTAPPHRAGPDTVRIVEALTIALFTTGDRPDHDD